MIHRLTIFRQKKKREKTKNKVAYIYQRNTNDCLITLHAALELNDAKQRLIVFINTHHERQCDCLINRGKGGGNGGVDNVTLINTGRGHNVTVQ